MSERSEKDLINDILICLTKIESYIINLNYDAFIKDEKTQDAVIRNLEIIGEAVKRLSNDFKENNPQIPWKMIAGTRDRLIHGYFGVNIDIVWEIANIDLPTLKNRLVEI